MGRPHFRRGVIPFSIHSHSRLLGAIVLLGVAGGVSGWICLKTTERRETPRVAAAIAPPTPTILTRESLGPAASPKQARLPLPPAANVRPLPASTCWKRAWTGLSPNTPISARTSILKPPCPFRKEKRRKAPELALGEKTARARPQMMPSPPFSATSSRCAPAGLPECRLPMQISTLAHRWANPSMSACLSSKRLSLSRASDLMPKGDEVLEEALGGLEVPLSEPKRLSAALATSVLHFGDALRGHPGRAG